MQSTVIIYLYLIHDPCHQPKVYHHYTIIKDVDEQSGSDEKIVSDAAAEIPSVVSQENIDKTLSSAASGGMDERYTGNPALDSVSELSGEVMLPSTDPIVSSTPVLQPTYKSIDTLCPIYYETDSDSRSRHYHPDRFVTLRR